MFENFYPGIPIYDISYIEDFSHLHGILERYPSLHCAVYAAFWVLTLRFWTL